MKKSSTSSYPLKRLYITFLVILVLAYSYAVYDGWRKELNDTRVKLTHVSSLLAQAAKSTLISHELVLRALGGELLAIGALDHPEAAKRSMNRMKNVDPGMVGFGLARLDGQLVFVTGDAPNQTLPNLLELPESADSFLQCLETNRIQFGRPYYMQSFQKWAIPIRAPVKNANGETVAVITAAYDLAGGNSFFANMLLPDDLRVALVREDGYLQYLPNIPEGVDPDAVYGHPVTDAASERLRAISSDMEFAEYYSVRKQRKEYAVYTRIPENGLIAVSSLDKASVISDWLRKSAMVTALMLFFAMASFLSYRRASRQLAESDAAVADETMRTRAAKEKEEVARRGAEEAEARFRAFMDFLPGYVNIKDAESRIIFCSQPFINDFDAKDWIGKTPEDLFPADRAEQVRRTDAEALSKGFLLFDHDWLTSHHKQRIMETRKFRIRHEEGVNLIGVILTDITEQRYNEEKYRVLFESSPDGIFLIQGVSIIDCNEQTLKLFDLTRDQIIGQSPGDLSPPIQPGGEQSTVLASEILQHVLEGRHRTFEWQHLRGDSSTFTAEVSLAALHLFSETYVVAFVRDISNRKQMQEVMVQTEKMISVGGIAAGIAHEINNPLGIVLQGVQNLQQRMRPDFPKNLQVAGQVGLSMESLMRYVQERKLDVFIEDIEVAANRASDIIRHMLDFSRRSESRRKVCDLTEVIEKALNLAGSDYDLKKGYDFRRIRIERHYGDDLPALNCTETEIEQVLLNLLRNAAQAIAACSPPVPDPRIAIRVTVQDESVRIEVADNGPGMPPEVMRRIFEPFYTTKSQGIGTGLGLSVSYFIITNGHSGKMSVSSHLGEGTTFVIELPYERGDEV